LAKNVATVSSSDSSLLEFPESTGRLLQSADKLLNVVKATVKQLLQQSAAQHGILHLVLNHATCNALRTINAAGIVCWAKLASSQLLSAH